MRQCPMNTKKASPKSTTLGLIPFLGKSEYDSTEDFALLGVVNVPCESPVSMRIACSKRYIVYFCVYLTSME
jgi:hypothetical protein